MHLQIRSWRNAAGWMLVLAGSCLELGAQQPATAPPAGTAAVGMISGTITDTDRASIPGAQITLEDAARKALATVATDTAGGFVFPNVIPGNYLVRIAAHGFSPWKVEDVQVSAGQAVTLTTVELGVEAIKSDVDAITVEDLAEQQITAEEQQRILGVLPNFFVSYVAHAQPLTPRQKFKLAVVVSRDPLTFFTTGITAGIEQAENDFAGYGPGIGGYGQRFAATYGDRLSSTFFGAAVFPSLFHQDPRYFYNGKGTVLHRALYAISTTVMCKGDNGKWQPNYSNVFGNLASGYLSAAYYPASSQHSLQVTFDNTMLGVAEGAVGTLFQEFVLRHVTRGGAAKAAPRP